MCVMVDSKIDEMSSSLNIERKASWSTQMMKAYACRLSIVEQLLPCDPTLYQLMNTDIY